MTKFIISFFASGIALLCLFLAIAGGIGLPLVLFLWIGFDWPWVWGFYSMQAIVAWKMKEFFTQNAIELEWTPEGPEGREKE